MQTVKIQKKAASKQQRHDKQKAEQRIVAVRAGDGTYEMFIQYSNGERILIGKFLLPYDNQIIRDYSTLKNIADAFQKRCNSNSDTIDLPRKTEDSFYDIFFQQIDYAAYEFYLPNGFLIGAAATPCDMKYGRDILLIKEICKQLAYRYDVE